MNYMGSKSRISKYIVPIIQKYIDDNNIDRYLEPFVGGGNLIDKVKCEHKYGSDNNKYLISLFQNLDRLECLPKELTKEHYSDVRNCYNNHTDEFEDWYVGAIGFLGSYDGRFFDGGYAKPGYEKAKKGLRFRNYYQESLNNLLKQRDNLVSVKFENRSYEETKPIADYLIVCDPPYNGKKQYNTSKTSIMKSFGIGVDI